METNKGYSLKFFRGIYTLMYNGIVLARGTDLDYVMSFYKEENNKIKETKIL